MLLETETPAQPLFTGLNTGFCGLSKNAWGSPNIPRTFLGSSSSFLLSLQRCKLHTESRFWIMSLTPAQVLSPSYSQDSGLEEMQTTTEGWLNHPSEEPVSSLTRDGPWADVASQVAFRRDNPCLTGCVVPWVTNKKAHKTPQPGEIRFPFLPQSKPIQMVIFSLLPWLLVQMYGSRWVFCFTRQSPSNARGIQAISSRPHSPTPGCNSSVPGLGGELPFAWPPKHFCLFELVVQNVSVDYSVPLGALEEAEIMKKY